MNREQIKLKTETAIRQQLYERGYATCIDCLVSIGWLKEADILNWRRGKLDYIERACCTGPAHLNTFLKAYHSYAINNGYSLRWTCYKQKKTQQPLRFSRHHDEATEKRYAMHIVHMQAKKKNERKIDK